MSFEPILYLAVLILVSKIFGELLRKINQPSIIGNVLAGVVVGPALFAIVKPVSEIDLFVSIGIFFLFFLIGLEEIDLQSLFKVLRKRIFAGAVVGFLIPFTAATLFSMSIDIDIVKSLAIASVIGASSLGVTAKILTDLGKLKSTIGLEIFTVTAIIEFIAIIVTSVLIQINGAANPQMSEVLWFFAKMIIFFVVTGLISVYALPPFFRLVQKHLRVQQIYFGIVVGIILLVAYFAEISGIHGAVGALMLGIAVSRMSKIEHKEISQNIHSIGYGIFIPIFFAGIGLHFNPDLSSFSIWIIVGFLGLIVLTKYLGSYLAVRIAKMHPAKTVAFGVMSKGAVDLALMLSLLEANILDERLYSLLIFGTLITMVISSVELQRRLVKTAQVKIGSDEITLVPTYFRRVLSDSQASNLLDANFVRVQDDQSIEEFLKGAKNDLPIVVFDKDQNVVGIATKKFLQKKTKKVVIGAVMYRKFHIAGPTDDILSIIQKINSQEIEFIPIMQENNVIGIISSNTIIKTLS